MPGQQGRLVGTILLAIALVVLLVGGVYLLAGALQGQSTSGYSITGALLGFFLLVVIAVVPLGGGGIYLLTRGRQESAEYADVAKEKKILNMVLAQGQVNLSEVALELGTPRKQVEEYVRDLVGKNLFSGAINWQDGILYSKQASQMKADHKCPNCGGTLELAGKDVIKCPFCGSEVFLSS